MKFKNSIYETRWNEYWNETVVKSDKELTRYLNNSNFFRNDYKESNELLKKYCDNLVNFLYELHNEKDKFSDRNEVTSYLLETNTVGLNDLRRFNWRFRDLFGDNTCQEAMDTIDAAFKDLKEILPEANEVDFTSYPYVEAGIFR